MIYDIKKDLKKLYAEKKPIIIDIPKMNIISIEGEGDPNTSVEFKECIEKLYKVAYFLRMSYKKGIEIPGYYQYVVAPLEGFWTTISDTEYTGDKSDLKFKLFLVQPEFITKSWVEFAKEEICKKEKTLDLSNLNFEVIEEGKCAQIMHIGSFDTEEESVEILEKLVHENGLELIRESHHEIYLSDFRKVEADKIKTIIRYKVRTR